MHAKRVAELTTTMTVRGSRPRVAGTITGFGGDTVIIDDPIKPMTTTDVVRRKRTTITRTVFSRSNDMRTGCVIIAMSVRMRMTSVATYHARAARVEGSKLAGDRGTPQTYTWDNPLGQFQHHRAEGDVLHPARTSFDGLKSAGSNSVSRVRVPIPAKPAASRRWYGQSRRFKRYRDGELPKSFDVVAQSWDCANTASELSSFSCCITIGIKNGRFYLPKLAKACQLSRSQARSASAARSLSTKRNLD